MSVLLDTNILLRLANPIDRARATAMNAVTLLTAAGESLYTVPQNLFEFWAVATRPVPLNGLGMSTAECAAELVQIKAAFPVLFDKPNLLSEWEALVTTHDCKGKVTHDARLVAAMRTHGLTCLLTFNVADFARYPGLSVIDPNVIVATTTP